MVGCSKKNRENYPGKCFGTKEKETGLRFNPRLALIGLPTTGPWGIKANNWAQKKKNRPAKRGQRGEGVGGGGSAAPFPPQPQVPSIPCSVPLARAVISFFSPSGTLVPG